VTGVQTCALPIWLWHGVLAFGLGLVLGTTLDAVPAPVVAPAADAVVAAPPGDETVVEERRGRRWRQRPTTDVDTTAADAPLTAEQETAAHDARPHTVTVGPNTTETRE